MSRSFRAGAVCFLLVCSVVYTFRGHRSDVDSLGVLDSVDWSQGDVGRSIESSQVPVLGMGGPQFSGRPGEDNLIDVKNATLGFQKILILSMPGRSDRRDALALSAYLTGLEIEFVEGIAGADVSSRAYPPNWTKDKQGTLGCWRGHMNIYQRIVRERIQTVLIMEDDVDWDVMLKSQMTEFARGTRYLQKATPENGMYSPYGDSWDLLFTGHCGALNRPFEENEYWVTENDSTVVRPDQRDWNRKPDLTAPPLAGDYSRVVFSPHQISCTASYAISLRGASRMVYDQAILPNAQGIDSSLGGLCKRRGYQDTQCLAAYPMITGVHLPAGDMSRESDRRKLKPGTMRKVAESTSLVYPMRLSLGTLLKGETVVKAQFPEKALLQEIDVATFELPSGGPVLVKPGDYVKEEEVKRVEEKKEEPAPLPSSERDQGQNP